MQKIIAFDGVNLGFAAQTDRRFMVPSVRNADNLSTRELDGDPPSRRRLPRWEGGELAVRRVTELTFNFDHFVCGGGTPCGFLRYVGDAIGSPGRCWPTFEG